MATVSATERDVIVPDNLLDLLAKLDGDIVDPWSDTSAERVIIDPTRPAIRTLGPASPPASIRPDDYSTEWVLDPA